MECSAVLVEVVPKGEREECGSFLTHQDQGKRHRHFGPSKFLVSWQYRSSVEFSQTLHRQWHGHFMLTVMPINHKYLDSEQCSYQGVIILYSWKFSHGANFHTFRMHIQHTKIKTLKIQTIEVLREPWPHHTRRSSSTGGWCFAKSLSGLPRDFSSVVRKPKRHMNLESTILCCRPWVSCMGVVWEL